MSISKSENHALRSL